MRLKTMGWLLAVLGQGLIALCFFAFFNMPQLLGTALCCLDFIVISLIYWFWIGISFNHPINLDDASGKQAAGLGMKWTTFLVYAVCAATVVVAGMVMKLSGEEFPIKWQLCIQSILLFSALVWLFTSGVATNFAGKVYEKEQRSMAGKKDIGTALRLAEDTALSHRNVPEKIKRRITAMKDNVRYLSPSDSEECYELDSRIITDADTLRLALKDYKLNEKRVARTLDKLERHFAQRKQAY